MAFDTDAMTTGEHFLGLDILQVEAASGHAECATLVEIWKSGVLVYTSEPIAPGTPVQISAQGKRFKGIVDTCEKDPYGQLVAISIPAEADWFPGAYTPPYIMSTTSKPDVMSASSGR